MSNQGSPLRVLMSTLTYLQLGFRLISCSQRFDALLSHQLLPLIQRRDD